MGGGPGLLRADEGPDADQVAVLVEKLGNEDFAVREQAGQDLLAMGAPVVEMLGTFREDPDPEKRRRIRALIGQLTIHGNELEWIDPKHEDDRDYWSVMGKAGLKLVFKNVSRKPVRIFWLEPDGSRRVWRGILKPGEEAVCERSYMEHTWVVTDVDEKALGLYRIDRKEPVVVVRDR